MPTSRDRATHWLLACGAIGPVLFVLAFTIEGTIRPSYDQARMFVSQLSFGDQGWQQITNFLVFGALLTAFAVGLRRAIGSGPGQSLGPLMVGLVGIGVMISGIFVDSPGHDVGALLVFGGLPLTCCVFAIRFWTAGDRSWATYSLASGIVMFALFLAAAVGAESGAAELDGMAGWLQRASIVVGFGWVAALGLRVIRHNGAIETDEPIARVSGRGM